MRFLLNTGRTIKQGITVEAKTTPAYAAETSRCFMHPFDMMDLEVFDGDSVRVESASGAVVLTVYGSEAITPGTVFVPYGPYANFIIGGSTHFTGMPDFKSTVVAVTPTVENKKTLNELQREMGGLPYDR
jgi:formylmethanofuran dehydrogenase subunit D